jgi:hypothetical protein
MEQSKMKLKSACYQINAEHMDATSQEHIVNNVKFADQSQNAQFAQQHHKYANKLQSAQQSSQKEQEQLLQRLPQLQQLPPQQPQQQQLLQLQQQQRLLQHPKSKNLLVKQLKRHVSLQQNKPVRQLYQDVNHVIATVLAIDANITHTAVNVNIANMATKSITHKVQILSADQDARFHDHLEDAIVMATQPAVIVITHA